MGGMKRVTEIRPAGEDHQVVTVVGGNSGYRRKVCSDCPWRKDAVGKFPAEAFKHSANTSYDMSDHVFSCHQSGIKKPATCAGFLMRGADNNMAIRIKYIKGEITNDLVEEADIPLHDNYREMAIANGVELDDESLRLCRD
jgi:Family of unknown function (DUF6283)